MMGQKSQDLWKKISNNNTEFAINTTCERRKKKKKSNNGWTKVFGVASVNHDIKNRGFKFCN